MSAQTASGGITLNYYVHLVKVSEKFEVQVSITPFVNVGKYDRVNLYESEADLQSDLQSIAGGSDDFPNEAQHEWVSKFTKMGNGGLSWSTDHAADDGWLAAYFGWDYLNEKYVMISRSRRFGGKRILQQFEHIVVLMDENRSLDNLLGYLYATDSPKYNIPPQITPTFEGLQAGGWYNEFTPGGSKIYASSGAADFTVPTPDPGEAFSDMTEQIFGEYPASGDENMSGFLTNYAAQKDVTSPEQIMTSYSPDQVPVISALARGFAVSDAWHASAPCQTWPNRGFVHTGSSDGQINNVYEDLYDINTIFNLLEDQYITWGVFTNEPDGFCLTHDMFPKLWDKFDHFHKISDFMTLVSASADAPMQSKLPSYSFIEPLMLTSGDQSYHPPHDVQPGEDFLAEIYDAIRKSPYRDQILFLVIFDEHGGCYDHVNPPRGAVQPEPWPVSRDAEFDFKRFGVRIPAIAISSYTDAGGVFRSETSVPIDHTTVLATLREWYGIDEDNFKTVLPSPRIAAAPTLQSIVTRKDPRSDWPEVNPLPRVAVPADPAAPVDGATLMMIAMNLAHRKKRALTKAETAELQATIRTRGEADAYIRALSTLPST